MSVELPSHQEVAAIAGFAAALPERCSIGELDWTTTITTAPGDEWVVATFDPKPPYPTDEGIERVELYLWRFSLAVHQIDGARAIIDPPITPEDLARQFEA